MTPDGIINGIPIDKLTRHSDGRVDQRLAQESRKVFAAAFM